MAGYFGDKKLKTTRGSFWTMILGLVLAYYYAFSVRSYDIADGFATSTGAMILQLLISLFIFALVSFIFYHIGKLVGRISFLSRQVFIPVDSIVSRSIEILISMERETMESTGMK